MNYIEQNCTFTSEGQVFEAGGAMVLPTHIVAYTTTNGTLTDWHGKKLGTWRSVAKWRVRSCYGTHMHQIEARVNGITYTGRGFGEGCIFRGKPKRGI